MAEHGTGATDRSEDLRGGNGPAVVSSHSGSGGIWRYPRQRRVALRSFGVSSVDSMPFTV